MNRNKRIAVALTLGVLGWSQASQAAPIISPVAGVIDSSGPGFGSIINTINQAGLSVGFVSGVTDFDTYIGLGPTHTNSFGCCEWFGNSGTSTAIVTYDLGAVTGIDRLALWNEESSGIGHLNVSESADGVTFSALLSGLTPPDNPLGPQYPATVYSFGAVNTRYVRLEMSGCPQADPGSFPRAPSVRWHFDRLPCRSRLR